MPVTYTKAGPGDEVLALVFSIAERYHAELPKHGVTVGVLWADRADGKPAVTLHGYPCAAAVRRTPYRDRVQGVEDAVITIDRDEWGRIDAGRRAALIDHELTHLTLVRRKLRDGSTVVASDDAGRPKLALRPHDVQAGWFHAVARRHGADSYEVAQARRILDEHGQLYFDFAEGPRRGAAAAVRGGAS